MPYPENMPAYNGGNHPFPTREALAEQARADELKAAADAALKWLALAPANVMQALAELEKVEGYEDSCPSFSGYDWAQVLDVIETAKKLRPVPRRTPRHICAGEGV